MYTEALNSGQKGHQWTKTQDNTLRCLSCLYFKTFFTFTDEDTKNPYPIFPRKLTIQRNVRTEIIHRDQVPRTPRGRFSHRAVTQTVRDKTEVEMELQKLTKVKTNSITEQFLRVFLNVEIREKGGEKLTLRM